jgi:hypothetical protein
MGRTTAPRWQRWNYAIALALVQSLRGTGAAAEAPQAEHPAPEARGPCSLPPSAEPRTASEEARALYQQFECHFARAEYSECLQYIERACQLTSSPRCLFNLGAVHHVLRHCSLARGYYEQFLDRAPYDDGDDEAKNALREIEAACPPQQAAPAQAPPPHPGADEEMIRSLPDSPSAGSASGSIGGSVPADAPLLPARARPAVSAPDGSGSDSARVDAARPGSSRRALAWTLLGTGAAAGVSTLLLGSYGTRAESDFDARDRRNGRLGLPGDSELRAIDRRGHQYNQLMLGFGAASGLLLAAGGTLMILDIDLDLGLGVDTYLSVSPRGTAGIDLRRSF